MNPQYLSPSALPAPPAELAPAARPDSNIPSDSSARLPYESVAQFLEKTGFPDLTLVSSKIPDHAKEIALSTAPEFNLKIRYLAFDGMCSVAHGCALPGSDLDELIAVVELVGVKRRTTLWDRICFRDTQAELIAAENAAAQSFQDRFKTRLDRDLIGHDQTLKTISLCELEDLFLTFKNSGGSIPWSMMDAEDLALSQKQGSILVNDLYKLGDKWGHTDAYQRYLTKLDSVAPISLPRKFKTQSRENLLAQFKDLSHDEQLLIVEIMRCDVSNAIRPAVLCADGLNPYLNIAKKLEEKKLLFFFDPADERMKVAIDRTLNRTDWIGRAILSKLALQRYVAPWKLYHLDELILSEYFDPDKMQALNQTLLDLPTGDGLPKTLKAWWSNLNDPDIEQRSKKLAASIEPAIKRTGIRF
jgi:hypothetical protein